MAAQKTIAKANGLKSTFLLEPGHLYMTSFGKGAQAQPEKNIRDRTVTDLRNTFRASVPSGEQRVSIEGKAGGCLIAEPQLQDRLHARETIENYYFGESYQDNIHIQLAYNIMDIQKILAAYTAVVVYTVNHMDRESGDTDFLGTFKTQNSYELTHAVAEASRLGLLSDNRYGNGFFVDRDVWREHQNRELKWLNRQTNIYKDQKHPNDYWSLKLVSEFLCSKGIKNMHLVEKICRNWDCFRKFCRSAQDSAYYFGSAFAGKDGCFDEKKTFEMLRLLGEFRQNTLHGNQLGGNRLFRPAEEWYEGSIPLLSGLLDGRVQELNDHFCTQNKVNIQILTEVYPDASTAQLVKEYYDFLIRKSFKNLGFSVRKLREAVLGSQEDARKLTEKEYDSVRGKLYSLMDFIIYRHYLHHEEDGLSLVKKLRLSRTEEEKDGIYLREADRIWSYLREPVISQVVPQMTGDAIKVLGRTRLRPIENLHEYMQDTEELCLFSKAIYVFSLFLDGKEINMLLSDLISKFENIASFLDTLRDLKLDCPLTGYFQFFLDSQKIAGDLRFIQSIARMNKGKKAKKNSDLTVKRCQYLDSAAVFGEENPERVTELYHLDTQAPDTRKEDKSLRNFMINNVINNNRFAYVVRFLNPRDGRKIMQSAPLVEHILKKIPESQLERYCKTTGLPYDPKQPENAVQQLTKLLLEVRFDNFLSVKQKVSAGSQEAIRKETYKAVVSLYLTVLYQIVKTMVRINSRYMIAFGILERDLAIYNLKTNTSDFYLNNPSHQCQADAITRYFVDHHWLNSRVLQSCRKNSHFYDGTAFIAYRNKVEHMQTVTLLPQVLPHIHRVKSMFDIFHCVLFYGIAQERFPGFSEEVLHQGLESMEKYNTVWKDLLYGLNLPFAYNAARYINLSNREQFLSSYGK